MAKSKSPATARWNRQKTFLEVDMIWKYHTTVFDCVCLESICINQTYLKCERVCCYVWATLSHHHLILSATFHQELLICTEKSKQPCVEILPKWALNGTKSIVVRQSCQMEYFWHMSRMLSLSEDSQQLKYYLHIKIKSVEHNGKMVDGSCDSYVLYTMLCPFEN